MQTLEFPKVSQESIRLLNNLIGKRRSYTFELSGSHYSVKIIHPPKHYSPTYYVGIKISDYDITLGMTRKPGLGILAAELAGLNAEDLPEELLSTIGETLAKPAMEALERSLHVPVELTSLDTGTPTEELTDSFYLEVTSADGHQEFAHLQMDRTALEYVLTVFEGKRVERSPTESLGAISLSSRLEVGREKMTLGTLKTLSEEDILILSNKALPQGEGCRWIVANRYQYAASIDGNEVTIEHFMDDITEETLPEEIEVSMAPGGEDTRPLSNEELDQLEISLSFELGKHRVSIASLRELSEGYTFELENTIEDPVDILANGKKIGKGHIMDVDGKVGVRITELKHDA